MIPDEGLGQANFVHNEAHSGLSATHAAVSSDHTRAEIFALAEKVGWRALGLSRGPFHVIELWLEK